MVDEQALTLAFVTYLLGLTTLTAFTHELIAAIVVMFVLTAAIRSYTSHPIARYLFYIACIATIPTSPIFLPPPRVKITVLPFHEILEYTPPSINKPVHVVALDWGQVAAVVFTIMLIREIRRARNDLGKKAYKNPRLKQPNGKVPR